MVFLFFVLAHYIIFVHWLFWSPFFIQRAKSSVHVNTFNAEIAFQGARNKTYTTHWWKNKKFCNAPVELIIHNLQCSLHSYAHCKRSCLYGFSPCLDRDGLFYNSILILVFVIVEPHCDLTVRRSCEMLVSALGSKFQRASRTSNNIILEKPFQLEFKPSSIQPFRIFFVYISIQKPSEKCFRKKLGTSETRECFPTSEWC